MANKNSAAKIAANNKYNNKVYDKISVAIPKGTKEMILAKSTSINKYINKLIEADLLNKEDNN